MPLTSDLSADRSTITIRISGRFDFGVHREFRDAYTQVDPAGMRFDIDLSRTEYIDSSALGMMLLLREQSAASREQIRILNCNQEIRRILRYSQFEKLFTVA